MGDDTSTAGLVTVSCSTHHDTLIGGLWYFLTGKHRVDCDVVGDGQTFRAHQLIVDVFLPPKPTDPHAELHQTLLNVDLAGGDDASSSLATLLEFMYNGTVTVPNDRLDQLLTIARELDFKMLVDAVEAARSSQAVSWQNDGGSSGGRAGKLGDSPRLKRGHVRYNPYESSDSEDDWDLPSDLPDGVPQDSRGNRVKTEWSDVDSWSDAMSLDGTGDSPDEWMGLDEMDEMPAAKRQRGRSDTAATKSELADGTLTVATRSTIHGGTGSSGRIKNELVPSKTNSMTNRSSPAANRPKRGRGNQPKASQAVTDGGSAAGTIKSAPKAKRLALRTCPHCSWQTRNTTHMRVHLAKHDSSIQLYRCSICNKPFTCPDSMANHEQRHNGEPELFQCEYCDYNSTKKQTLKSHQNYRHREEIGRGRKTKSAKCSLCSFSCVYQSALRLHVMMRHTGEKPIRCEECSYSTVRSTDLAKHVRVVHRGIKLFVCEICGLKCGHGGALKQHSRVHTKEKPFACKLCDKAYGHSSQLKEHEKWHNATPKPHVCHICGHCFRRRDHLRIHLRGVHKFQLDAVGPQKTALVGTT